VPPQRPSFRSENEFSRVLHTSLSMVPGASALSPLRPFPMAGFCRTKMVNEVFSLGSVMVWGHRSWYGARAGWLARGKATPRAV